MRLLDVDLRVLLTWNVDNADLDMWVVESSGEKVSYSNKLSRWGGKISNDMTDGYGPEEYLIRRAQNGRYSVLADFYGEDFINPNGSVVTQVEIYTNWGRENQTRAVTVNQFTSSDDDEYQLAEIEFGLPAVSERHRLPIPEK